MIIGRSIGSLFIDFKPFAGFTSVIKVLFSGAQNELYKYQQQHNLPYEGVFELRSKASLLLLHGDIAFESIRPSMPKVVYIGGDQCHQPNPLKVIKPLLNPLY